MLTFRPIWSDSVEHGGRGDDLALRAGAVRRLAALAPPHAGEVLDLFAVLRRRRHPDHGLRAARPQRRLGARLACSAGARQGWVGVMVIMGITTRGGRCKRCKRTRRRPRTHGRPLEVMTPNRKVGSLAISTDARPQFIGRESICFRYSSQRTPALVGQRL